MGRRGGGRWKEEEEELRAARRGYKEAVTEGNREEEARWANVIGDIHKRRGEYVEALRWLRSDYEVSVKYLPQRHLLPSCQSLGEVYLRLGRFSEALTYQKKHLQLAKDSDDLIEQQRASTQLGRTYYEILLKSEDDHSAMRNAKKYFKSAMKLAKTLKENSPSPKSSFLKEFIDSYNNLGMLDLELDNFEEAEKLLLHGLKICDDEEVNQYDDARSRLHNNLGSVYTELRTWDKAKFHIEMDIEICRKIRHPQGEAKGFINLGELHSRLQKYEDAKLCYNKALDIAKCLEDEDALVNQICQNIETVTKAAEVLDEMRRDEQKLKKLVRAASDAHGTSNERNYLLQQHACLDDLIEKARMISVWSKHKKFAKWKKRVATELCDKEKLSDALLSIGESYQKLRDFSKARKWHMKSWNMCRLIRNLEGQALAKVNIGEALDSSGNWDDALQAFEEGYRIAVVHDLPGVKLIALENMHYSHMVRFDNIEEAKNLREEIKNLKHTLNQHKSRSAVSDYCSETETEGGDVSDDMFDLSTSDNNDEPVANKGSEELDDDVTLASLVCKNSSSKIKASKIHPPKKVNLFCNMAEDTKKVLCKPCGNQQPVGRKRVRVVLSDDEADDCPEIDQSKRILTSQGDSLSASDTEHRANVANDANKDKDTSHPTETRNVDIVCTPCPAEESICSFKSRSPVGDCNVNPELRASSVARVSASKSLQFLALKIGEKLIYVDPNSLVYDGAFSIESLKVEVACVYYLQITDEKRSNGLLPVIGEFKYCGKVLDCAESRDHIEQLASEQNCIEAIINDWVPKRLMKLYVDFCMKLSEAPNRKLLTRLYNLEVSEDEVIVSDCGLQDLSITPFLDALRSHKMIAMLDLSHNLLGNQTMEKLQQIFASSSQTYGGLTLDLHCNRFGPTALFQICECAVMTDRLEVLNLSGNRLTDACSSYLFTILQNCKALYSLNVEQCSITSRTIQKIADALHEGSVLSRLLVGKNNPISGSTMLNLLTKLASLTRFSELSLAGVKLNKLMVDKLCLLAQTSCMSALLLGGTSIGLGGTIKLTEALSCACQELLKLDLSNCGLASPDFAQICTNLARISILELNLSGNSINLEACDFIGAILVNPECSLRSLILDKCNLGLAGIIRIIQALAGNDQLEELHIAENIDLSLERTLQYEEAMQDVLTPANQQQRNNMEATNDIASGNVDHAMEVADSEDEAVREECHTASGRDGSCASSCQRNPYAGYQMVQELAEALISAKHLKVLDLSRNGLSEEAVQLLYSAWVSGPRGDGTAAKHASKEVVHFSVNGMRCCGLRPCCRRD